MSYKTYQIIDASVCRDFDPDFFTTQQEQLNDAIEDAAAARDYKAVHMLTQRTLNKGWGDAWHDIPATRTIIGNADFYCYTCFMKHQKVIPQTVVCYSDYAEQAERMRQRNCGLPENS